MSSKCAKIHQTLLVDPSVNVLNFTDEMFVRPNETETVFLVMDTSLPKSKVCINYL